MGKVKPEDLNIVKRVLGSNRIIYELFGGVWIKDNIVDHPDIGTMHPLFFGLLHDPEFPNKLRVLKEKHQKYKSFAKKLKKDEENFDSHVSSLDVFFELSKSHNAVELEPPIPNTPKSSDVKITVGGSEYWGEVVTINCPEDEYACRKLTNETRIRYNRDNKTEHCVSVFFRPDFKDIQIEKFIKFLLEGASSIELNKGETRGMRYWQNAKVLAEVTYSKKGDVFSRGYFGFGLIFRWDISIGRIKRLMADKIRKFQFPADSEKKKFFYICVRDDNIERSNLDCALFGEENPDSFPNRSLKEGIDRNALIYDNELGSVFRQIDFVVYLISRTKGKFKFYRFNRGRYIDEQAVRDSL